ncbi:hypothetical protein LTR53_020332, partial [Teratosphaeriaceae sp. CCFEE 6253]
MGKPVAELTPAMLPALQDKDDEERSVTGTIDEIEEEAAHLMEEATSSPSKARRNSDAPSVRSSIAMSLGHQRLNSLRSSQRISHSTVATT